MIDYLKGELTEIRGERIIVETGNGLAYEIFLAPALMAFLPGVGELVKIYVVESTGMYGGTTTLYGFLQLAEREVFLQLKDNVPGTGAKKALEYFNKIAGDTEKFQQAVAARSIEVLIQHFGFTRKTADKLVAALKDKLAKLLPEKTYRVPEISPVLDDATAALVSMGYKPAAARSAVEEVQRRNKDVLPEFRDVLRQALTIIR